SANMKIRFVFSSDSSNWNNQTFEGPSVDNVRLAQSSGSTITPLPAMTPTPGTPVPCTPISGTPTATPTPCTINFRDVQPGSTFYNYVRCLFCRGAIAGYPDGTFRPDNSATRGQITKIV